MESFPSLLQRAQQGDREAAQRILEENSGLIWSVARRYFGRGVDADDLYQLGCLGFIKAIEGLDEDYGPSFPPMPCRRSPGDPAFSPGTRAVKVSRGLKERAQQIHSARVVLEQRLGASRCSPMLSAFTGNPPEEIAEAETAVYPRREPPAGEGKRALPWSTCWETTARRSGCWSPWRCAPP
jgi:RNA polymerase sporulation-specific sigma factor